MTRKPSLDFQRVRDEIAAAAARMIVQDGLDYATAKRKAARQIVGDVRLSGEWLPDNDQLEEEIHEYQAIFLSDSQPAILRGLRQAALRWMERLAQFHPYLTDAVLNGTASAHSDIYLQLFCDSPKDVAIYLVNANIQYDVAETRHFAGRGRVETLSFMWRDGALNEPFGIHLALYNTDDLRGTVRADARKRQARVSARDLRALLGDSDPEHGKTGAAGRH